MRRLGRSRSAQIGASIVVLFVALAVVGPTIAPYDPIQQFLRDRLQAPSTTHWLGTDALGRDILSRLLEGSRISLSVGIIVGFVAVFIGVPIGVVAGYRGGPLENTPGAG
jgi:ABC-type dipeptide/oligopeptide/nickel transport system permease subunit